MNLYPGPQKQRRNRKKKEVALSPQAAREEAELRQKIQQNLQTQYVDRATVENGGSSTSGSNNPVMMYGQMGLCGMVGDQDGGMNNTGMNNEMGMMMQQQQQQQQGMFGQQGFNGMPNNMGMMDLSQEEMAECMKNAEIKAYEMSLHAKRMALQQKMQAMKQVEQQLMWQKLQQQGSQGSGMMQQGSQGSGMMQQGNQMNEMEIMRELRLKQERMLQMGAAQKHMEEINRGMSSGSESNYYNRGFSGNDHGMNDPMGFTASEGSSFFSGSESDVTLAKAWYDHQKQSMNSRQNSEDQFGRQNSHQNNGAYEQNNNVVDLTQSPQPHVEQLHNHMATQMNQNQFSRQSPSPQMQEMMMQQQMMRNEQTFNNQFQSESPSPDMQNMQTLMMMERQMMQNQRGGSQGSMPQQGNIRRDSHATIKQGNTRGGSYGNVPHKINMGGNSQGNMPQQEMPQAKVNVSQEEAFAMLRQLSSSMNTESDLETLLSLPMPSGGSVRDSLTVGDLQAWLKMKNSQGNDSSIGFHSVGNMSASFTSVMGEPMEHMITPGATPGTEDVRTTDAPLRKVTNEGSGSPGSNIGTPPQSQDSPRSQVHRGSSNLDPIAEDQFTGETQKPDCRGKRISLTVDDLRESKREELALRQEQAVQPKPTRAPGLKDSGKKQSLTVSDLVRPSPGSKSTTSTVHSQNSGMSLSLGDFAEDLLDINFTESLAKNSMNSQSDNIMPMSLKSNQSDMMMSMDSLTFSALMKANDSNGEMGVEFGLSDVQEGDNESRASTTSNVHEGSANGVSAPLQLSQGSKASSMGSKSKRRSNKSNPSVMSEISKWSSSNPYGDDGVQNDEGDGGDQAKEKDEQKSGVDVTEVEALHDSVDFSLSMMSSICMSEMGDNLMMSMQKLEVSEQGNGKPNE